MRDRGGLEAMRERAERTLAEYLARTRATAARLSTPDSPVARADDVDVDNDVVESWMADPRGGQPERRHPAGDVVDRIERGQTSWDDVLSGRATDRDAVVLREFLRERVAEIHAARQVRR